MVELVIELIFTVLTYIQSYYITVTNITVFEIDDLFTHDYVTMKVTFTKRLLSTHYLTDVK